MGQASGYYKGLLETKNFRRPFIVFASSNEHATEKALNDAPHGVKDAIVSQLEGPYHGYKLYLK